VVLSKNEILRQCRDTRPIYLYEKNEEYHCLKNIYIPNPPSIADLFSKHIAEEVEWPFARILLGSFINITIIIVDFQPKPFKYYLLQTFVNGIPHGTQFTNLDTSITGKGIML